MINQTQFTSKQHLLKVVNKKDNYVLCVTLWVVAMLVTSFGNLITN